MFVSITGFHNLGQLYDLMTMGFKHQLISCSCPEQLVQVTMSHLEALQRIVDNSAVNILLTDVINNVVQTYATMPSAEFWHLKRVLCRFFQDRRVKVSLFLQDSMQNLDGTMVLHRSGPVPVGAEPPGPVRYFEASGTRAGEVQVEPLRVAGCVPASAPDDRMVEAGVRECTLGSNLYSKERRKDGPKPAPGPNAQVNAGIAGAAAPTAAAAEAKNKPVSQVPCTLRSIHPYIHAVTCAHAATLTGKTSPHTPVCGMPDPPFLCAAQAAATTLSRAAGAGAHELTLLSSLLGAADTSADNFKLNLFPDAATYVILPLTPPHPNLSIVSLKQRSFAI